MFYVIGKYGEEFHILAEKQKLSECQHSIWWQGQPRGELTWHNKERTHATTGDSFRGKPVSTEWFICTATTQKGVFKRLCDGAEITTARGAYTVEAFNRITEAAQKSAKDS